MCTTCGCGHRGWRSRGADASMVSGGLTAIAPRPGTVVLVDDAGNLVCPGPCAVGDRGRWIERRARR